MLGLLAKKHSCFLVHRCDALDGGHAKELRLTQFKLQPAELVIGSHLLIRRIGISHVVTHKVRQPVPQAITVFASRGADERHPADPDV